MDESKLSEALRALADRSGAPSSGGSVATRARRRLRRNITVGFLSSAILVSAGVLGLNHFRAEKVTFATQTGPTEESARSTDGTLECTASLPSPLIQPGASTGLSMEIRNVDDEPLELQQHFWGFARILDEGGTLLEEGRVGGQGGGNLAPSIPPPLTTTLAPGESKQLFIYDVTIRWPGNLQVVPICPLLDEDHAHMPPMQVEVANPGAIPAPGDALDRALIESDGLFEKCKPKADGSWTTGLIEAPDGNYDPMTARCSAVIESHVDAGFVIVGLRFVSPSEAPEVEFAEGLWSTELPGEASMSIGRWTFLVTRESIKEIEPLIGAARTRGSSGFSVGIQHTAAGWLANSESICGSGGFARAIIFISPCPP